jgi:hypothetical protein
MKKWFAIALVICGALVVPASAQEGGSTQNQPMSLQSSETTSTESSSDTGGFWFFPSPAPLEGMIATDRPAFSDTASLVPRGRFQIEGGYTFSYDREGDKRTYDHLFPEIALRTGLTDWLEFRAKWNGYSLTETMDRIRTPAGRHVTSETHDDSGTDLNLGFKLPIHKQKDGCWMPTISVIPSLYVPTGGGGKTADNVVPEIKFPWNYVVCKYFTVYGSILGRVQDGSSGQFYQTAATLAGNVAITDRLSMFCEYFGVYPALRDQDCSHLISAGPIWKITDNLSIDARVGVGLNEQAPDFQTAVGFGIRF